MPNSPVDVDAGAPNPESYTTGTGASAGTVTDNVTGLMWQQTTTEEEDGGPPFTWGTASTSGTAQNYCATLSLNGTGWRLPTIIELVSIADYGVTSPAINATYFPNTPTTPNGVIGGWFWSSTPLVGSPGFAWSVAFGDGVTSNAGFPVGTEYVRCVRGGVGPFAPSPAPAPPGRYTTTGAGAATTVYDTKTKLTWQQTPTEEDGGTFPTFTWGSASTPATAQNYCAELSLNGTGWRLPTVGELLTLVDYSQTGATAAMIDATYFPSTPYSRFWSSTPTAGFPGSAWCVYFSGGSTNAPGVSTASYVRCVR